MPKREDERWSIERKEELRCCPACNRYGRYYYNKKMGCWICGWCEKSFPVSKAEQRKLRKRLGCLPFIISVSAAATLLVITAMTGWGCQKKPGASPTPVSYTVESSQAIACAFLLQDATYRYDSRHSGYGDRTGQILIQVITPHEAKITVKENKVTRAVIDVRWSAAILILDFSCRWVL